MPDGAVIEATLPRKDVTVSKPRLPEKTQSKYEKAKAEVNKPPENPFDIFRSHQQNKEKPKESEAQHKFSAKDVIRHKILALEARRAGVKDIEGFKRLVRYFDQSYDLSSKNIPVLKAMLETGVDPVPFFEGMISNTGYDSVFLDSSNLRESPGYQTTKKFIELLKTPGAEKVLPILRGMSTLPHERWKAYKFNDSDKLEMDTIISIAKSAEPGEYPPEAFGKINIIARCLNRKVSLDEIPAYIDLINNPDKLAFLSEMVIQRGPNFASTDSSLFAALDALQKDGLLKPLTTLMQSGIQIDTKFLGGYKLPPVYEKTVTQEEINQRYSEYIQRSAVQDILKDPERQIFGRVLERVMGGPVLPETANELYPMREEFMTVASMVFPSLYEKYRINESLSFNKVDRIEGLIKDEKTRGILLSPEFFEFLDDLKAKGVTFEPRDFFEYRDDMFAHRDEHNSRKSDYVIVQLFKAREICDLIDPAMPKDIIEGLRSSEGKTRDKARDRLFKLEQFAPYLKTITLLRENGVDLNPENFGDANWIARVNYMELLGDNILESIPQERRSEWIKSVIRLPGTVQRELKPAYVLKAYKNEPQDIERVVKLAQFISSTEFLKDQYKPGVDSLLYSLASYEGKPEDLFTDGKPNDKFVRLLISSKENYFPDALSLILTEEMFSSFEGELQDVLRIWKDLPKQLQGKSFGELSERDVESLKRWQIAGSLMRSANLRELDDNLIAEIRKLLLDHPEKQLIVEGKPTKDFIQILLGKEQFKVLPNFLTEDVLSQYSEQEQMVFGIFVILPDDLKKEVLKESPEFPNVSAEKMEQYKISNEAIDKIKHSSSAEIKRLEEELIGELWRSEDPKKALDEILNVFERNNLPLVGKVYRVFEILHPPKTLNSLLEGSNLSPALKEAGTRRRYDIIYKDLLKVHIDSANPSLYAYLTTLRDGQALVDKVQTQGLESLNSESEVPQLVRFLNKMETLYENSLYGRRAGETFSNTAGLEERIQNLRKSFNLQEGQSLVERISAMFVRPLGYENVEQVIKRMEEVRNLANERNIQYYNEASQNGDKLKISAGDLLKGVNSVFLEAYFQNGSVAKEYLGASSGSDSTPFDTDASIVLPEDLTENYTDIVSNSLANRYGKLIFLFRNRGQFQGAKGYELFQSGVLGERHYAIRTGIASTEIDAAIVNYELADNKAGLERLFFDIAQAGFYIPVIKETGAILFKPEDYEKYRLKTREISDILSQLAFVPSSLVSKLKESPYLARLYEADSGVSEGYSLEEHSNMVLGQFEKYFSSSWSSPVLTRNQFRTVLALHDLGKPLAVQMTGSTREQHDYTMRFIPPVLEQLGFNPREAQIAAAVIDQDYLGDYIKGNRTPEQTAEAIKDKAAEIGVSRKDMLELLRAYYMSDAGSYTVDAGGQASLDRLFSFGKDENGNGLAQFAPETQGKFAQLLQQVYL